MNTETGKITSADIEGLIDIISYANEEMEIDNIASILESENISRGSLELGLFADIFCRKAEKVILNDNTKYSRENPVETRRNIIFSLAQNKLSFLAALKNCSPRLVKIGGSSRVCQILSYADLALPLDQSSEDWWHELHAFLRNYQADNKDTEELEKRGVLGERLSMTFEKNRLSDHDGSLVERVSVIDGDEKGFDVLSFRDIGDEQRLRIEVKASISDIESAVIHVTWNEWKVANGAGFHVFHLWPNIEKPSDKPIIVTVETMSNFIPETHKGVKWNNFAIPMKLLSNM